MQSADNEPLAAFMTEDFPEWGTFTSRDDLTHDKCSQVHVSAAICFDRLDLSATKASKNKNSWVPLSEKHRWMDNLKGLSINGKYM